MKDLFVIKAIAFLMMVFGAADTKCQSLLKTQGPFDSNLYSITNTGSYLVYLSKFDYQTGIATAISPSVVVRKADPGPSAIDPVHHRFIVETRDLSGGGDTIYTIDLGTGLVVNKNRLSLSATRYNEVLEYNCRDTTLYSMVQQRSTNGVSLCSIDPLTGVQTLISPAPITSHAGSGQSALDPVNRRFFFVGLYDTLYSVNLTSGLVINRVKLSSSGTNYHSQFEYNSEDQTLYSVMGGGNNSWFTKVNPLTGLVTKITPGPGKLGGYVGTFQSALDPVNNLYFCFANDSLCAVNIATGTYAYKNKAQYGNVQYGSIFLGFETPCTQKYTGLADQQEFVQNTQLFPNPFSSFATLALTIECRNASLDVYDLSGKKVKEMKELTGSKIKISRDDLPAGMYFIRLRQDNTVIGFEKIVISD